MDETLSVGHRMLYMTLMLSAPPVIVATLVGLIVGLFQTVTQLQEQTLPYGLKLVAVVVILLVLMSWMSNEMLTFATTLLHEAFGRRP
jgi:type III secretion protein S